MEGSNSLYLGHLKKGNTMLTKLFLKSDLIVQVIHQFIFKVVGKIENTYIDLCPCSWHKAPKTPIASSVM